MMKILALIVATATAVHVTPAIAGAQQSMPVAPDLVAWRILRPPTARVWITPRLLPSRTRTLRVTAPAPWAKDDPADSLYRAAREALGDGEYAHAADLFHQISVKFPSSEYAADALYYEAFALYRNGRTEDLSRARSVLEQLGSRFPASVKKGDAATLATRICGELAQRGDERCATSVAVQASVAARAASAEALRATLETTETLRATMAPTFSATLTPALGAAVMAFGGHHTAEPGCVDEDNDERIAALNALLQMDADRAVPVLQKVLARRDRCSATLRSKAVFLISQKRTPQTVDILLAVAQNDPDPDVRGQAVFWLSQVPDERAVDVLANILKTSSDEALRERALTALAQNRGSRGPQILREVAQSDAMPEPLRERAILSLGQRRGKETGAFLRELYPHLTTDELKDRTLSAIAMQRDPANAEWLLNMALNTAQPLELRKKALFWAGQVDNGGLPIDRLVTLYDRMPDQNMRKQLIYVYARRHEPVALDKLISIAKNDKDADLRKQAIFWLGQSHDPKALQALTDLISK